MGQIPRSTGFISSLVSYTDYSYVKKSLSAVAAASWFIKSGPTIALHVLPLSFVDTVTKLPDDREMPRQKHIRGCPEI